MPILNHFFQLFFLQHNESAMDCTTTLTGRLFLATKAKVVSRKKRVPVAETKNRNYSIGKSKKEREKLIQIS